jgi:hypothetical protein
MKYAALALLTLLPAPALAGFECKVDRQCGGGTCEAYAGGPFLIEPAGDLWEVKSGDQTWQAFDAGHIDDTGELLLVMPPQGGMSGMVTIFPEGQFLFTAHAAGPVAISGEGACVATGG